MMFAMCYLYCFLFLYRHYLPHQTRQGEEVQCFDEYGYILRAGSPEGLWSCTSDVRPVDVQFLRAGALGFGNPQRQNGKHLGTVCGSVFWWHVHMV